MQKIQKSDEEWRGQLTDEQYRVLRLKGTEPPYIGKYVAAKDKGMYLCAACGAPLFSSETKFDSGTGWPSFYDVATKGNVKLREDLSWGMRWTEVICAACGGHLGHVFDDGPTDKTGLRYCINSCALELQKDR